MYDDLIKRLRSHANSDFQSKCDGCKYSEDYPPCIPCIPDTENAAADAIEELSKPRWISVEERLPETYTWVLVFAENHKVGFDAFYDGSQWKNAIMKVVIVTHWMPLPEPPEEE